MFDFLKLKKEVSESTADIDSDDVVSVKTKLKGLGHYKEPKWGVDKIVDNGMFEGIRNFQKEKGLKVDGIMKPEGETEGKINEVLNAKQSSSLGQVKNATIDLYTNYKNMRKDGVRNNDDYFHCRGNFEATQRGSTGEATAKYLGDLKERFDYFKNRIKGVPPIEAYADYAHDQYVNDLGRQQAKNGLYSNSKDGCKFKRMPKTNARY